MRAIEIHETNVATSKKEVLHEIFKTKSDSKEYAPRKLFCWMSACYTVFWLQTL